MKQQNIDLKIEGYMYDEDTIQPVDICTIFANAIDNAIEGALKEDNKNKRFINIFIKENKNFVFTKIINNKYLKELPFILETPNDLDGYKQEIKILRENFLN